MLLLWEENLGIAPGEATPLNRMNVVISAHFHRSGVPPYSNPYEALNWTGVKSSLVNKNNIFIIGGEMLFGGN